MELQFVKVSPNENMTLLIESPVPRSQHLAVAKALIAYGSVYAEQAGYIEEPENKAACARLQMMAGEFCGNATLSLGAYLFSKEHPQTGAEKNFLLEVSGADSLIDCHMKKEADGYLGQLSMPLPAKIATETYVLDGVSYELETVYLPGITHIIVPKGLWGEKAREKAEQATAAWENQIAEEAFGILLFDESEMTLEPLVCVKNASLVWERGCGSGTTALGAALATKKQYSLSLGLKQPGGVMYIDADWKDGCLHSLTLTVRVKIVAAGTAYLESF